MSANSGLLAYHGNLAVKSKYVGRMKAHVDADEIVRRVYWDGNKGCAIGCTVHSDDHGAYETELGMPEWFAHLEDTIFEGMSVGASRRFPLDLLSAIPVGFTAWDRLYHEFCAFLLRDVCKFNEAKYPAVTVARDAVISLHERWTETDNQAWVVARKAAWSAADVAAQSTRSTLSATWAAVAAAYSADLVTWSAAEAANLIVRRKARDSMGDWLIKWFAAASGVAA